MYVCMYVCMFHVASIDWTRTINIQLLKCVRLHHCLMIHRPDDYFYILVEYRTHNNVRTRQHDYWSSIFNFHPALSKAAFTYSTSTSKPKGVQASINPVALIYSHIARWFASTARVTRSEMNVASRHSSLDWQSRCCTVIISDRGVVLMEYEYSTHSLDDNGKEFR